MRSKEGLIVGGQLNRSLVRLLVLYYNTRLAIKGKYSFDNFSKRRN